MNGFGPEYTISLSEAEFNVILAALQEAPMASRLTAPVTNKVHTQVREQILRQRRSNGQTAPEAEPPEAG